MAPLEVIDAMDVDMKPLVGKKPAGSQMIDTSKEETIKVVANDSMAKGDRVVIVLLEGSKNAQVNHIKNRIKAVAGLTVTQALSRQYKSKSGKIRKYSEGDYKYDLKKGYILELGAAVFVQPLGLLVHSPSAAQLIYCHHA